MLGMAEMPPKNMLTSLIAQLRAASSAQSTGPEAKG